MKNLFTNPLYLGAVALGGLYFISAKSAAGGDVTIIDIAPGETWQITYRAVGGKISSESVASVRKVNEAFGNSVNSLTVNDSGDTAVLIVTSLKADKIPLNRFMPSPLDPSKGVMITAAERVAAAPPKAS